MRSPGTQSFTIPSRKISNRLDDIFNFFLFGSDTDWWLLIFWFLSLVATGNYFRNGCVRTDLMKGNPWIHRSKHKEFFTLLLALLLSLFGDNLCKVYLYYKCKIQWFLIKLSNWVFYCNHQIVLTSVRTHYHSKSIVVPVCN